MALWDSADLLARSKRTLNRPSTDSAISDPDWYAFLTEAQSHYYNVVAAHFPEILYSAPAALSTADSGLTYTFASSVFPFGNLEIRHGRSGPLLRIGPEWDPSVDLTFEGDTLRVPDGKTRSFSQGLYARYISPPDVIASGTAPTLKPSMARVCLVFNAVGRAAVRLGMDPNPYASQELEEWETIRDSLKKQYWGQGLGSIGGYEDGKWWHGIYGGSI